MKQNNNTHFTLFMGTMGGDKGEKNEQCITHHIIICCINENWLL